MKLPKEVVAMLPPVVKGAATHTKNVGIQRVTAQSCDLSQGTSVFSTLSLNDCQFNN